MGRNHPRDAGGLGAGCYRLPKRSAGGRLGGQIQTLDGKCTISYSRNGLYTSLVRKDTLDLNAEYSHIYIYICASARTRGGSPPPILGISNHRKTSSASMHSKHLDSEENALAWGYGGRVTD